mmetsp:Transcript_18794/g.60764  ORF Transcript_18794/g.60764 Transcript_18794/m.60764 type:complete len:259 (-) Transcript_18794:2844-3620(-)
MSVHDVRALPRNHAQSSPSRTVSWKRIQSGSSLSQTSVGAGVAVGGQVASPDPPHTQPQTSFGLRPSMSTASGLSPHQKRWSSMPPEPICCAIQAQSLLRRMLPLMNWAHSPSTQVAGGLVGVVAVDGFGVVGAAVDGFAVVGAAVGDVDGVAVDGFAVVGAAVGDVVAADGDGVGVYVGTDVGSDDGHAVGVMVGAELMVGPYVGTLVGAGVGAAVMVGPDVGKEVGAALMVGAYVGTEVDGDAVVGVAVGAAAMTL